jgi:hypothetical protein
MARQVHETSGLAIMVDKWIPHSVHEEAREKFTKKFLDLAGRTKDLVEPVLHPIVMGHPKYNTSAGTGQFVRNSIFADFLNLHFTYNSAQDLVAGFSFQLLNDLALYNAEDCTFWAFDSFSDFINGVLLLLEDNKVWEATQSFAYSFHKYPVAYEECKRTVSDYSSVQTFLTAATSSPSTWGTLFKNLLWNLSFNWVDLIYEAITLHKAWIGKQWTMIGTYLAKMSNDVLFKNPNDSTWNFKNSDVLNSEWGQPPNLLQGIDELSAYWGWGHFLPKNQR